MNNAKRWTTTIGIGLVVLRAAVGGQALNEAFLRSAVLVTFEIAPGKASVGTGFFLFLPVKGDQGNVLLITNKHVLPPLGTPRSIQIRVTVGSGSSATVRSVEVPLVGKDGKYLDSVRLHPNPGYDVAAVNVTETIVKQGIQATWLPLDLLSTPERLKNENITVGDEIFQKQEARSQQSRVEAEVKGALEAGEKRYRISLAGPVVVKVYSTAAADAFR